MIILYTRIIPSHNYARRLYVATLSVVNTFMSAHRRLHAVMMTALVDARRLLPPAVSTKVGAQAQRPLASVVICGAISSPPLTRVFQPTLVYLLA
jgi:Cu/Ag efflux pump CusA